MIFMYVQTARYMDVQGMWGSGTSYITFEDVSTYFSKNITLISDILTHTFFKIQSG